MAYSDIFNDPVLFSIPEKVVRIALVLDERLQHKPEAVLNVFEGVDVSVVGQVRIVSQQENGVGENVVWQNVGHGCGRIVHLDHLSTLGDVLKMGKK